MGMTAWLQDAWNNYSLLGVEGSGNDAVSRRVILSNRVAAVVFVMGIGVTAYFLSGDYSTLTLYWFMFLLGAVWVMPFLNALGNTGLSRHILSSLMPLFIVGITAHTRVATPEEVHGASFYIPRFYLMAISFFPLLLFTQSEKWRMFISLGVNASVLLFFNELLGLFGAGMGTLEPAVDDAFFISISSVICLGVIGSGFYFLNNLNNAHERRIEELLLDSEEKNLRIQSAISYAKDIQQTVLPLQAVEEWLKGQVFTFFRPLDVVSGDFYMLKDDGRHILMAVIDCTGHGVPGAFVSLLAHAALQRAVREHGMSSPAKVLGEANRLFHQDFSRSGNPHIRDGMDAIMCSLDTGNMQLHVSGANLTAYVVNSGKMTTVKGDRGGIYTGNPERVFQEHTLEVKEGDMVFITSDGFPDQFGGAKDKRIGKRAMEQKFLELSSLPVQQQQAQLASFFDHWKGSAYQVDDVCVMGLRV